MAVAWPGVATPPTFEMILGVRQVYNLIRDAQRTSGRDSA